MFQKPAVTSRQINGIGAIDVIGDVTASAEGPIKQAYQNVSLEGKKKILLVFREQDDINSAGIAIFIDLVLKSRQKEETIRIVQPSDHFRKIFELVALNHYVEIFSSETEALDGF